jgi:hypothetical protein
MHSFIGIIVIMGEAIDSGSCGRIGRSADRGKQSEAVGVSRREALGRFGAYTAPATLLAMLVAEKAVAASAAPD